MLFIHYNITHKDYDILDRTTLALFPAMIYAIAYLAILRPGLLFRSTPLADEPAGPVNALPEESLQLLIRLMETEKLYLDPNLKYSALAERMGASARQLSAALNSQLGVSFRDFVNAYRVEEVQRQLQSARADGQSLLSIALAAGFNSKATFNRAFKKHAGQTPTEYLAGLQRQPAD